MMNTRKEVADARKPQELTMTTQTFERNNEGRDRSSVEYDFHVVGIGASAGGLVLVQSEESAKVDGMPKAVMDTGIVDLDLPPEELPAAILKHARAKTERLDGGSNEAGNR